MSDSILRQFVDEFKHLDSIYAIVLSGSKTSLINDEKSDYDIYIYSDKEIDVDFRHQLAEKYAQSAEINNQYFETGDELVLKDSGLCFDIMYRNPAWIEEQVDNVWRKHYASVGYSTCFLYNVKNSKILYEKNGWFSSLQSILDSEYPDELSKNIIKKNLPLLRSKMVASYREQIEKSALRRDWVGLNHRISAFLASYFDILFAHNKVLHPGEKKLIEYALKICSFLPPDFDSKIAELIFAPIEDKQAIIDELVDGLEAILL